MVQERNIAFHPWLTSLDIKAFFIPLNHLYTPYIHTFPNPSILLPPTPTPDTISLYLSFLSLLRSLLLQVLNVTLMIINLLLIRRNIAFAM